MTSKREQRKIRVGFVVSDHKMRKTIRVEVERLVKHPIYKKYYKRTSSFLVHDEQELCHAGDRVKIMETRPISNSKHWRLVEVLEKAREKGTPVPRIEGIDAPVQNAVASDVKPEDKEAVS